LLGEHSSNADEFKSLLLTICLLLRSATNCVIYSYFNREEKDFAWTNVRPSRRAHPIYDLWAGDT